MSGRKFDPGVRVDAVRCRSGDRLAPLERQARGVCEEVGERRPRRPGSVVEGDAAFFQGDETGEADQQLGHRCPVEAFGERPGCSYDLCAGVITGPDARHDAGSGQPRPSCHMRSERCAQRVRSSGHRPSGEGKQGQRQQGQRQQGQRQPGEGQPGEGQPGEGHEGEQDEAQQDEGDRLHNAR